VVRTRYQSDADSLTREGTDRVVVDELESIVQLFADVLQNYRIPAEEIAADEDAIRRGGYVALREASDKPVVLCDLNGQCFDTRTVVVRGGAPLVGESAEWLMTNSGLEISAVERHGIRSDVGGGASTGFQPGDVVTLAGSADAFANAAALFRPLGSPDVPPTSTSQAASRPDIDVERLVRFTPHPQGRCTHLDRIQPVYPSARGCEDCLRIGEDWVHLRICLTCGHVGCCDTSKNKHATKHYHATTHPIVQSLQPGEDWGWCYPDEVML
jgi:monovalent cation:H+ antiporter-2, CPA2 family